jgi:hypothetical protein
VLGELFKITPQSYEKFSKKFGLNFKYLHERPLFGASYFIRSPGSPFFIEDETRSVSGTVFLKNEMRVIYEDGELKGVFPYRPFYDIIFRLGNSDTASSTIEGLFAKTLSLAYLSVGNTEVYCWLKAFYRFLRLQFKTFKLDVSRLEMVTRKLGKKSNTFFMLGQRKLTDTEFPTLAFLRQQAIIRNEAPVYLPRPYGQRVFELEDF